MFKVGHRTLIFISGFIWLFIGLFLLSLGFRFLIPTAESAAIVIDPHKFSMFTLLAPHMKDLRQTILVLITVSFFIGYLKGKFVLSKAALRQVKRIFSLPKKVSVHRLFGIGYYILIAGMITLGISLRFWPITPDTRGCIDIAIGAALISGSLQYFRFATTSYQNLVKQYNRHPL